MSILFKKQAHKNKCDFLEPRGFTLVEVLIGTALFVLISIGIYKAYTTVLIAISASRANIVAMDLANERFEIIRNLPYADVGIELGVPPGKLRHVETFDRSGYLMTATTTVRNIDLPFDGTIGGSPNDLSPADNKLVEVEIGCPNCKNFRPLVVSTNVAPKNLETASTNGALFIRVLDASGQPVPDANVSVNNGIGQVTPVVVEDTTNADGMLQIVDAPPGVNVYSISTTKSGHTSDKTYKPGDLNNPNPLKPFATVAIQQVTQISFIIDKFSSLDISTLRNTCSAVPNVGFSVKGTRLIGVDPDTFKYSKNFTSDGAGKKLISDIEWDSYNISLNDASYDILGTNPLMPISLLPDTSQDFDIVVAPKSPRSLLVVVRDASSGLPIASSSVNISSGAFEDSRVTGRGFINQTDWSGGSGQDIFNDTTMYYTSSFLDTNAPIGELKLHDSFGIYEVAGELTSSTFDTGSAGNFHQLSWRPVDQPVATGNDSVRMQIATNNDGVTWNFVGPDGTASSYYTSPTSDINPIHNGDRYLRYKIFLSTSDASVTPNVSDISFTFTSSCVPPGQVFWNGLSGGTYDVSVWHDDYSPVNTQTDVSADWQKLDISLTPQ